jgi:RNA polymerase sigma-70 factor (ECF subfamily)
VAQGVQPGNTSAMMSLRDDDVRLMLLVRDDDDSTAFAELVDRYRARIVGVMHHLLNSVEEAEDLAQEVFLRVYRTRAKYHPSAKFSTWLFTIANNLALNVMRRRRRKPSVPLPAQDSGPLGPRPAEQLVADSGAMPTRRLAQQELAAVIRQALEELNERQKLAVVLNKFEEMNYAEIADVMGLTPKAVKSLLSRARARLKEVLHAYVVMPSGPMPVVKSEGISEPEA